MDNLFRTRNESQFLKDAGVEDLENISVQKAPPSDALKKK